MPGMEMPVRMTTAMLFFIVGGVAAYYATKNPGIWWVSQCSFTMFVALGPLYWLQGLLLPLPWRIDWEAKDEKPETDYYIRINNTDAGKYAVWGFSLARMALILLAIGIAGRGLLIQPAAVAGST